MLLDDLVTALGLLTVFPAARLRRLASPPNFARCAWAFPAIGFLVGAAAGLVYGLARWLGAPPLLAAPWAIAAAAAATGALHEDGLADLADSLGGATRERRLEIMRDSRIGAFGALALIFSTLIRVAAAATIADPTRVLAAAVVSAGLGRAAMLPLLLSLQPARQDGIAASMANGPRLLAAAGGALAVAASFALLPASSAAAAILAACVACAGVGAIAFFRLGGYTGDALGAAVIAAECLALTAIAAARS